MSPYPLQRFLEHYRRRTPAHGLYKVQTDQNIHPSTGKVHMGWQMVLLAQLDAVFITKSVFGRQARYCIANLAI